MFRGAVFFSGHGVGRSRCRIKTWIFNSD